MTQIRPTPDGYDLMIDKPLPGTDAKILASGFERQPVSPETLALLVNTRAAFARMALARAEIEARQAARQARQRARRPTRV